MTNAQRLKDALDLYRKTEGTPYQSLAYDNLRRVVASLQPRAA